MLGSDRSDENVVIHLWVDDFPGQQTQDTTNPNKYLVLIGEEFKGRLGVLFLLYPIYLPFG